jgi:hypothetical protein
MKVVAFITDYIAADRIIDHLKRTFIAEKPPPFLKNNFLLPPPELHGQDPVRGEDPGRDENQDEKDDGHVENSVEDRGVMAQHDIRRGHERMGKRDGQDQELDRQRQRIDIREEGEEIGDEDHQHEGQHQGLGAPEILGQDPEDRGHGQAAENGEKQGDVL